MEKIGDKLFGSLGDLKEPRVGHKTTTREREIMEMLFDFQFNLVWMENCIGDIAEFRKGILT